MTLITKLEFDVEMTCNSCSSAIREALLRLGEGNVNNIQINVNEKTVFLETNLPHALIQDTIENTGRRAILKGYGSAGAQRLDAAVIELTKPPILGVIRLLQATKDTCVIDGTIDGLAPGEHGMHICEFGDLSEGCLKLGNHYNPSSQEHGGPNDEKRHYGDLGNITANEKGRAQFKREDSILKVWDVIGRSLAVTANTDDLGRGSDKQSKVDGNSGDKVACGVVARSAGLFENPKRVCQCSGATVWEERDEHK